MKEMANYIATTRQAAQAPRFYYSTSKLIRSLENMNNFSILHVIVTQLAPIDWSWKRAFCPKDSVSHIVRNYSKAFAELLVISYRLFNHQLFSACVNCDNSCGICTVYYGPMIFADIGTVRNIKYFPALRLLHFRNVHYHFYRNCASSTFHLRNVAHTLCATILHYVDREILGAGFLDLTEAMT